MKLNIGETIKKLRKEREITQEEFAEVLGVSCQSVSRWENENCYPDIELIPTIAEFFGISTDRLMGVDETKEKAVVNSYLEAFQIAISKGDVDECIRISREGVKEFPNNYELLDNLMYALFLSTDEDGNIPEWKENMEKYDAEITALGERIMKYCPDQNIRLRAMSTLAFNHCEMGRKEIGRAIYETFPSVEYGKENQMWWSLSEEEWLPNSRQRIEKGFDILAAGIYTLISYQLLSDNELLAVIEKRLSLDKILYDSEAPDDNWGNARLYCHYARTLLRLNRNTEAFEKLKIAVKCAKGFDNRPEQIVKHSILLGDIIINRSDFETTDSRTLTEIMRDKWLQDEDFDSIRDTENFKSIIKELN